MRAGQIVGSVAGASLFLINAGKRWLSALLPYRPVEGNKDVLEAEYAGGVWDYLRGVEELSRFSVVVGYCQYFKDGGSILEIGCGEGLLPERLDHSKYRRYVGIDISAEAIRRASEKRNEKTSFDAEDARVFTPDDRFDVIVFNECLYYFQHPLGLVRRYEPFLKEGGIFIVSMFAEIDASRTRHIWRMLESVYMTETETRVSNKAGYTWVIKVYIASRRTR